VLGVETEIRLARAVNFHHYDKGWHPTATIGVFGAAAAVGYLIGLDEERLSVALAIAASFASGVKANFGTMVKPLHVGQSARYGLLAALLAETGYDANPAVLEHKQGFFNAFNGPGNYDLDKIGVKAERVTPSGAPHSGAKLQYPTCTLSVRTPAGKGAEPIWQDFARPPRRCCVSTSYPNSTELCRCLTKNARRVWPNTVYRSRAQRSYR
jgi:hypothetical protein